MEENRNSCGSLCEQLLPLSSKYPWLVVQNLEAENDTQDQIFYPIHDPLSQHRSQIPELLGKFIRGCFHGWLILSSHPHNLMWSLWNPMTSKVINLPPLILKDGDFESIGECCLSSSPDDPNSVLMLMRKEKPTIVFCPIFNYKPKRLRWTEISYAKKLRKITNEDGFLCCPTCFNDKVYTLNTADNNNLVIQVNIKVRDTGIVINLLAFGKLPFLPIHSCRNVYYFLKGYGKELFYIALGFDEVAKKTLGGVYLFKLDMTSLMWEEIEDLRDAIFFVDFVHDYSVFYNTEIASDLGGYIHILGAMNSIMYSYNVKDKTVSLSSLPCLVSTSHVSLWECRLQDGHGKGDEIMVRSVKDDEIDITSITTNEVHEDNIESHLLNLPFNVLEMIMEFCVGVQYLNFRATCKSCQLAAPVSGWNNKTALKRLQTYPLASPWLMVFDKHKGVITFADPMFGNTYFRKTPQELTCDLQIHCSRYGWLLILELTKPEPCLVFFNPFTSDIRKLPPTPYLESCCFSAPPTSPDCVVVGFVKLVGEWQVYILFVGRIPFWLTLYLDFDGFDPYSFRFPTFYGRDIYALFNDGRLVVCKEIEDSRYGTQGEVMAETPRNCCRSSSSTKYFIVKCDQHILLVTMGEFGRSNIKVFRLNNSTKEWEKIDGLGRHTIYIGRTTCLCVEAKTPEMENKIYFPRLHSENGNIVFYSLETCKYHTSKGKNIEKSFEDFCGTKHYILPHSWIEPSWS